MNFTRERNRKLIQAYAEPRDIQILEPFDDIRGTWGATLSGVPCVVKLAERTKEGGWFYNHIISETEALQELSNFPFPKILIYEKGKVRDLFSGDTPLVWNNSNGVAALVKEYIPGESLRQSPGIRTRLEPVVSLVHEMHSRGVAGFDLVPTCGIYRNILETPHGELALFDLGKVALDSSPNYKYALDDDKEFFSHVERLRKF